MAHSWQHAEFGLMKAAVAALACLLRLAASAQAEEVARPQPSAESSAPPDAVRPWVDPASAQPIAKIQPAAPTTASPTIHDSGKQRQDASRDDQRLHQCLSAVETRQTVAAHRLAEPFRALRVGRQQGEALRAKLCKWKQDQFVYEVFVLRRDGRIVRVYMNAQNGQTVGALEDH